MEQHAGGRPYNYYFMFLLQQDLVRGRTFLFQAVVVGTAPQDSSGFGSRHEALCSVSSHTSGWWILLGLTVFCPGHLSRVSLFLSLNDRHHQFQQPCDPN